MSDDGEYDLVLPFIVCTSIGGVYDDAAFVAGAYFGEIWTLAGNAIPLIEYYVPPPLVPQLDLVAMHFGYSFYSEPSSDDWSYVRLSKEDDS